MFTNRKLLYSNFADLLWMGLWTINNMHIILLQNTIDFKGKHWKLQYSVTTQRKGEETMFVMTETAHKSH